MIRSRSTITSATISQMQMLNMRFSLEVADLEDFQCLHYTTIRMICQYAYAIIIRFTLFPLEKIAKNLYTRSKFYHLRKGAHIHGTAKKAE